MFYSLQVRGQHLQSTPNPNRTQIQKQQDQEASNSHTKGPLSEKLPQLPTYFNKTSHDLQLVKGGRWGGGVT